MGGPAGRASPGVSSGGGAGGPGAADGGWLLRTRIADESRGGGATPTAGGAGGGLGAPACNWPEWARCSTPSASRALRNNSLTTSSCCRSGAISPELCASRTSSARCCPAPPKPTARERVSRANERWRSIVKLASRASCGPESALFQSRTQASRSATNCCRSRARAAGPLSPSITGRPTSAGLAHSRRKTGPWPQDLPAS
jgi:hypothetical protein